MVTSAAVPAVGQSKSGNSLVTGRSYASTTSSAKSVYFCNTVPFAVSMEEPPPNATINCGLFKAAAAKPLYVQRGRICFTSLKKFIRNMILFKHFNYLVCDLKTNQVLICHKEGLLKTSANSYRDCLRQPAPNRGFVQYHPIHNYASLLFR